MLLIVNIGNSNLNFALFKIENSECIKSWIISNNLLRTLDEYFILFQSIYKQYNIKISFIQDIVIGSVVPCITNIIKKVLYQIHNIRPIIIDRYTPSSIIHKSHELGTDLYANAVASHYLYNKRTNLVIDFGTALSITCVDKFGLLKGVVIAPGINISLNALINNTAQLSQIELKQPKNVLCLESQSCIQSGIIYGYLSMIEGLINKINYELNTLCFVIATGGLSHIYSPLTKKIHILDKLHTMKGLVVLYKNAYLS